MPTTLFHDRDLEFLLYELLHTDRLVERERFADYSREAFDAVLQTARQIAESSARAISTALGLALIKFKRDQTQRP